MGVPPGAETAEANISRDAKHAATAAAAMRLPMLIRSSCYSNEAGGAMGTRT